jgi:hypothetical protein
MQQFLEISRFRRREIDHALRRFISFAYPYSAGWGGGHSRFSIHRVVD